MSWAIGRTAALLERLAREFVARVRRSAAAAVNPAEFSQPDVLAKKSSDARPRQVPDALRLRPEVEKPLLDAGMPPDGSSIYDTGKRPADTPEGAARKFVMWARAVGATGAFSVRTISALYWECAEVDHREPVAIDRFLRALKNAHGVRADSSASDRRRRVWIIDPARPKTIAKAQGAVTPKRLARSPQLPQNALSRFVPEDDYSSPQLLQATAHDARRQGRARKQRGSRNVRWGA
jgi:hypothetical protein